MNRPRIDWNLIYQEQLKALGGQETGLRLSFNSAVYYRDLRTIRMGTGRQNGKTEWIIDKFLNNHDVIVICKDRPIREAFAQKVEKFSKENTDKQIQMLARQASPKKEMAVRRDGKNIVFTVDENDPDPVSTVENLMAVYGLWARRRIFTERDLQCLNHEQIDDLVAKTKLIIVDDASYNTQLQSLYRWISTNFTDENLVVVCMG